MIYAKLLSNQELGSIPVAARYLYVGMVVLADDEGRLNGSPAYLRGQVFTYDGDITNDDVANWTSMLSVLELIKVYSVNKATYIQHPKWNEYQLLRKDRISTSQIPAPDGWQPNDNQVSTKCPPKLIEDKLIEDNTPQWFEIISNKQEPYKSLVKELAAKDYLSTSAIHELLLEGMVPYYREKGSALKERWEKERSFDYLLRARTWVRKDHEYKKDVKCFEGYWHRKGESCHHRPPEPDYKNVPVSEFAKSLNKRI